MKFLVVLVSVLAAVSAAVLETPYKDGDRYFMFPDDDGQLHLVDSMEPIDEEFIAEYLRDANNNEYRLFTRENPELYDVILMGNDQSLEDSHFDKTKDTVFLAHGWNGHGYNHMNNLLTIALLDNDDVNVIVLCWRRLANRSYRTARLGTAGVGNGLGEFINWLATKGLSYDKTHLIGFSLGGHLVGNAGRTTGGKLKRITALDPAGPMWSGNRDRVVASDAQYVEVIHTNTGMYGFSDPCGDADFYPNGGSGMPGCWLSSCSHSRAFEYMASTIRNNHLMANECGTLRQATRNRCTGDLYPMGNADLSKNRSGIFRVNTARNYPY